MAGYIGDFLYGATKYPCALFKPKVFIGHFGGERHNLLQQQFFKVLLDAGFKRTFWQLVFPGQTAGLIKRAQTPINGVNEYHVRFYADGVIECEFEVDRWSIQHWTGPRHHGEKGKEIFASILKSLEMPEDEQGSILKLFGSKDFTRRCIRL